MYDADAGEFTSKPDPKKEFAQYFRDSGAATALQKAMILLHRMPVKPPNLAEFFSQYFENGAQQLVRISLLKAELCYKKDELESMRATVKETEQNIQRMIQALGITEEEFNDRFFPEKVKEKYRYSVLQRYFHDAETKHLTRTAEDPWLSNTSCRAGTGCSPEQRANSNELYDMDEENDCIKNVSSQLVLKQDMKELDPWGIICQIRRSDDIKRKKEQPSGHYEEEENENPEDDFDQDDDAASLAELFQQASLLGQDGAKDKDEGAQKLHNLLLTVRQADSHSVREFMGWSPLRSREELVDTAGTLDTTNTEDFERKEIETLKRRPCLDNRGFPQFSHEEIENDGFLLDEDNLEHVYKMMESTQESFEYEFKRHTRRPPAPAAPDGACKPDCEMVNKAHLCRGLRTTAVIREEPGEGAIGTESLGFIPGKMGNWTSLVDEYPSSAESDEYLEYSGEGEDSNSRVPPDVPITRVDSSCHCVFAGAYDMNEMLSGAAAIKQQDGNIAGENSLRKQMKRQEKSNVERDTGTLTEDAILESELQQVFKNKHKSSGKIDKYKKEMEIEEETHSIDAFNIDLAKEVKRTILGIKPSGSNNNAAYQGTNPGNKTPATANNIKKQKNI